MVPPPGPLNLDVEAISGICGSISIACWVVVFSPQIIENFRRSSADGLSLQFIIVWLLGDVFNILGAVMQGVLPTMIILAIYYTIADIVLLGQCFYYRGFTWKDEVVPPQQDQRKRARSLNGHVAAREENGHGRGAMNNGHTLPSERTSLLGHADLRERRGSDWSDRLIHVNPVVPIIEPSAPPPPPSTTLQHLAWNTVAVLMVIAAGVAGWFLSHRYGGSSDGHDGNDNNNNSSSGSGSEDPHHDIHLDLWGQIFGWLCAVLYLGSRLPQLLLNYRRKSTEGVSMLFFLFACLGNLTYVLSIFAFDPKCWDDNSADNSCRPGDAGRVYGQYILVNLSWLAGSLGTLFLDMGIFVQFFIYSSEDGGEHDDAESAVEEGSREDDELSIEGSRWDQRPVLERNQSEWSN